MELLAGFGEVGVVQSELKGARGRLHSSKQKVTSPHR